MTKSPLEDKLHFLLLCDTIIVKEEMGMRNEQRKDTEMIEYYRSRGAPQLMKYTGFPIG